MNEIQFRERLEYDSMMVLLSEEEEDDNFESKSDSDEE
jgi:hypothetical protein